MAIQMLNCSLQKSFRGMDRALIRILFISNQAHSGLWIVRDVAFSCVVFQTDMDSFSTYGGDMIRVRFLIRFAISFLLAIA
jgi:hypothetical protein